MNPSADEMYRRAAERAHDRAILAAKLRGIEFKDLVDAAIAESDDDQQLLTRLAASPLNLRGVEAEAVLSMRVRDRNPRQAASLREQLEL